MSQTSCEVTLLDGLPDIKRGLFATFAFRAHQVIRSSSVVRFRKSAQFLKAGRTESGRAFVLIAREQDTRPT